MKTLSVRFYKRLILVILALLILVPTVLAVVFGVQNAALRRQLADGPAESEKPREPLQMVGEPLNYQTIYPELCSAAEIPEERVRESNTAYLTFNSTPGSNTEAILDVLDTYGVKATFFVRGTGDTEIYPILREIVDRGHALGLYGYSDSYQQMYSSVTAFLEDFKAAYNMVYEATGLQAEIFRYPGGSINPYNCGLYQELNAEMLRRNFVFFDWNVSGAVSGQEEQTGDQIRDNVISGMAGKDRAIIALQDAPEETAVTSALPGIIEDLRSTGYRMKPLSASVMPVIFGY